jgi:hypothetical protein
MDGAVVWLQTAASVRVREWVRKSTIKNKLIFAITTHLFAFPKVFPAISGQLKSVGEVWVAGAAVWLTAAAVTSCKFENSNARSMQCTTGDGHEHDGCSDGRNAVHNGRRRW